MQPERGKLAKKLGHQFADEQLLKLALTHRSVSSKKNNERLEFLGDSLLNFLIAEALYQKFPQASEGELSRMRSNLVRGETLSEISKVLNVSDYLHMGIGELKSGGHRRDSILADALEAIIAAIYLDAGIDECRQRVLAWYEHHLNDPGAINRPKDPKTSLQEWLQARQHELPKYTIIDIHGEAHEQTFIVECQVEGFDIVTTGSDTTRRNAEKKAALAFLEQLVTEHE